MIDGVLQKVCTIQSVVEVIDPRTTTILDKVCTIQSVVELVDPRTVTIESLVDIMEDLERTTLSKVCEIDQRTVTIESELDALDVFIRVTVNSKVDVIDARDQSILSKVCIIESQLDTIDRKLDLLASCTNPIDQADVGSSGFTITAPGGYKLIENIVYSPTGSAPAITIAASNVILDLGCFSITQGNAAAGIDGIVIASDSADVTIFNGFIKDFSRTGIVINDNSTRIVVQDLNCIGCAHRGVDLRGPMISSPTIAQILIDNIGIYACCTASLADPNHALSLSGCKDFMMSNCRLNENGIASEDLAVLQVNNSFKCFFDDIAINDNIAQNELRGLDMTSNSSLCSFEHCIIARNVALDSGSTLYGVSLRENDNIDKNQFLDCLVLENTAELLLDGFFTGIGCDNNLFDCCEASFNTATGTGLAVARGFDCIENTQNVFRECTARSNNALTTTVTAPNFGAVGFDFNITTSCLVMECTACDQDAGVAESVGILVNFGSRNIIRECQSFQHIVGFQLNPSDSLEHVFFKNFAGFNTIAYGQFPIGSTQEAPNISGINATLTNPWTNAAIG